MRRGYFTPPVLIILAIIIFAVAILIAINTDLVKRIKKEPAPIVQLPTPLPATQQSSSTPEETADWKTYTNPQEKITFKYPNDWEVSLPKGAEDPTLVTINSPIVLESPTEPLRYSLTIIVEPTKLDNVGDVIDSTIEQIKSDNPNYPPIKREKTELGNREAELTTDLPSREGAIQVFAIYNKNLYQIIFIPYDPEIPEWRSREFKKTFDQILSTFQFLD